MSNNETISISDSHVCTTTSDICPICLDPIKEGDNLAIKDVGAYGIVLSSNYNLRPRPIEIIVKNSKIKKISKKQNINDII